MRSTEKGLRPPDPLPCVYIYIDLRCDPVSVSMAAAAAARLGELLRCAHAHARQRRIYAALMQAEGGWRAEAPHAVHHWGSAQGQARRFEVLLEQAGGARRLRGASVADVGCGCGDLLAFLRRAGAAPREYVGYDIVPQMVEVGRERFGSAEGAGGGTAAFECHDVVLRPPGRKFDFVLSSGIFAFGNAAFFHRMTAASLGAPPAVRSSATGDLAPAPRSPPLADRSQTFDLSVCCVTDMAQHAYIFNLFEGKGYECAAPTVPGLQRSSVSAGGPHCLCHGRRWR